MSADDCIFCKIANGLIPSKKIYEDKATFAFLDIGPVSDGHTLVIPKEHFEKLHECSGEVLSELIRCVSVVADAVVCATGAEGYNVLCNNGKSAGQLVGHVHFHIIPRNSGDGVFDRWPAYEYKEGQGDAIAEMIRIRL